MRNKFPGVCYRCGHTVKAGQGHFEQYAGGWRTQHADCAIEHRGTNYARGVDPIIRQRARATVHGNAGDHRTICSRSSNCVYPACLCSATN